MAYSLIQNARLLLPGKQGHENGSNTEGIDGHAGADAPLQHAVAGLFQRARDLMMSMLISLGSVAWSST